jgi:hypothetical protein
MLLHNIPPARLLLEDSYGAYEFLALQLSMTGRQAVGNRRARRQIKLCVEYGTRLPAFMSAV